jgi:CheY-like chemotaxis protein
MAGNHILVIDDSTVISSLLDDFLTEKGFRVSLAATAEEAYAKIKEKVPDLIVLDLVLPDVHGLQFCRLLKSDPKTHHTPVIMATAKAVEVKDRVEGLRAGADDYITKPFELVELYERVNAVLRRVELERGRAYDRAVPLSTSSGPVEEGSSAPARPVLRRWRKFLDLFTEPAGVFSSIIKDPRANEEFKFSFWIVSAIPILSMLGRLLRAGPRLNAEVLGGFAGTAGVLSAWLALSGALFLLFSLRGRKARFQSIALVIGFSVAPLTLGRLLELAYIMAGGFPGEFSSDLTLFFPELSSKDVVGPLLRGVDIFELWSVALAGIGFSALFGLTRKKSLALASCLWLLGVSLGAAWVHFEGGHH